MLDRLADFLQRAQRLLVFSGAGISTGSGIPDFRGPEGLWTTRKPIYYAEFLASHEKRQTYWDYKLEGYEAFRDARPTACHRAIAALEARGRVLAIVTQNIDGLHQRAGSRAERVVEIHGSNGQTQCVGCGALGDPAPAMAAYRARREPPRCGCGGFLKLATISFGQALDSTTLSRAFAAAEGADAVLALGSTLSVHPAASVPMLAAERGAAYAVVNRGATDHDSLADLRIEGDVESIVPAAVESALASTS